MKIVVVATGESPNLSKTTDFSKFNLMILQKRALISYKRFVKAPSVAKNSQL
jgi:hypothetical protein